MFDLIKLFFDIGLLKKAPQHLPYSINLLKMLAIINVAINFLLINMGIYWFSALLAAVAGVLLVGGFSWICLFFSRKPARFCQMTSALLGADALIDFFAMPAIATMALNQGGLLVFLVMMALIIWHWLVTGHIICNALEQSFILSLGIAFLYLVVSYKITALIIA